MEKFGSGFDNCMQAMNQTLANQPSDKVKKKVAATKGFQRYRDIIKYFEEDEGLNDRKEVLKQKLQNCAKVAHGTRNYCNLIINNILSNYIIIDRHWKGLRYVQFSNSFAIIPPTFSILISAPKNKVILSSSPVSSATLFEILTRKCS